MYTRSRFAELAALAAFVALGCDGGANAVAPADQFLRFGVGTSPGFSDWITEPTIFNDPVQEVLPDPELCPGCPPFTSQTSGIVGGEYGFDSNDDGEFDTILTVAAELRAEVEVLADGSFEYTWLVSNTGSGALVGLDCGLNGPAFAIAPDSPLLGTAGEDRTPGTGDDLATGESLTQIHQSLLAPRTVLCAITTNPTTPRQIELLAPLAESPEDRAQCMNDGWLDFGFRNQGQCVRFVMTGEDSRS